ncbi:hypothetical protein JZ751_024571 [Albula glossodonta]|uniref:Uncharacterized protein n=1 Tax=Albula glossodonta TaxID=121402 RepID=A0A8T2PLE5_9TELE|nr:hypothetical protein JZ751_024571 [Albula glossodonta]
MAVGCIQLWHPARYCLLPPNHSQLQCPAGTRGSPCCDCLLRPRHCSDRPPCGIRPLPRLPDPPCA